MTYEKWRVALWEASIPEFHPLEWQDELLASGQGQFWATDSGAIITQIVTFPSGSKVCRTHSGAGDLSALLNDLKPQIEAWAKAQGCSHCLIEGRDGWKRVHPDYSHHQTILTKTLS